MKVTKKRLDQIRRRNTIIAVTCVVASMCLFIYLFCTPNNVTAMSLNTIGTDYNLVVDLKGDTYYQSLLSRTNNNTWELGNSEPRDRSATLSKSVVKSTLTDRPTHFYSAFGDVWLRYKDGYIYGSIFFEHEDYLYFRGYRFKQKVE